jgi:hypothetical protein
VSARCRNARRLKTPCMAQLFSGWSVSTSNSGNLFRDTFEFARRPSAYSFYFGFGQADLPVQQVTKVARDQPEDHQGASLLAARQLLGIKTKRRKKVPPGKAALLRRSEFAVQPASLFRFDWSSVSTFWTCSHLRHSKVSRSETAGPCSIRASIMGAWHLGQRGRSIGISDGSAG